MTEFLVYDVFTDTPFGGNQLAVIPDAAGLAEADLQRIAREFNFSETVFIYPPERTGSLARLRIFTPMTEVPFAGHPTIGAVIALRDLGRTGKAERITLDLGVGPLDCGVHLEGASFTTSAPLERLAEPEPELIARALGLEVGQLKPGAPPVQATIGLPFAFVELADGAALDACQPDVGAMREGAERYPASLDFAILAFCRDGSRIDARMFAPLDNVPEDPATGSAAATLALLLADGGSEDFIIRQGDAMGRPSRIAVSTRAGRATVAGNAVRTMEGRLVF